MNAPEWHGSTTAMKLAAHGANDTSRMLSFAMPVECTGPNG